MYGLLGDLRKKIRTALVDVHATRRELAALQSEVIVQREVLAQIPTHEEVRETLAAEMRSARSREDARFVELSSKLDLLIKDVRRAIDALQVVYDEEPENRRRLHALRERADYDDAFSSDKPLISILIPTYQSYATLRDRAIPSVLEQTYTNWELLVVGDCAPREAAEVVASFADERIRFTNQITHGPYPEDEYDAWLVTAVPPWNAALRLARGQWIAPFADDDALRPYALDHVLTTAQAHRYELCYAKVLLHARDGTTEEIGAYPPGIGKTGISAALQGSIFHAGLRFFEQELADAIFETPSDWSLIRRMLRAGVRVGFHDEIACDYFPSYRGEDAPGGRPFR